MGKTIYIKDTNAVSRCLKARDYGVSVSDITNETFNRATVAREAVKLFKFHPAVTIEDTIAFIHNKFSELAFPSNYVRELCEKETVELVRRYLIADNRKSLPCETMEFQYDGYNLSYKPSFVYFSEEEIIDKRSKDLDLIKVPVVEVVAFTVGMQKHTSGNAGSAKEFSSLHHNLDGLGLLMCGKKLLKGKAGVVRCVSDSLKTEQDKSKDGLPEFAIAPTDNKGAKARYNRNWFEVYFSETGKIIPHNTVDNRIAYDNSKLYPQYSETLLNFLEGKDHCSSQDQCKKYCKYYELCYYNHQPVKRDEKIMEKRESVEPSLNAEQKQVVDFRTGICCVDAGPGSGKTQCMAYRIAQLLVEGERPEDILVMSFSKAAVKVITNRVKYFVHDVYGMTDIKINRIKVATFNSLGNELIEKYYKELGYSELPCLIDEVEMYYMMKDAIDFDNPCEGFDYKNYKMKALNRNQKGGVIAEMMEQISLIREHDITRDTYQIIAKEQGYTDNQIDYIWKTNERYSEILIANNLIDYSDQCYQVLRLIDSINPDAINDTYRYSHIIVDEFQDSNDFQMLFISELINTGSFKSLLVTGDDAQAIYGFRGTSPENIIHFREKMNTPLDVSELYLVRNYRSTPEIVELSNEILSHNTSKIQKNLVSNMEKSEKRPILKGFDNTKQEIEYICDSIESLIASGVEKNQIAVICFTKAALKRISKELSSRNILSQYDMGERLLDNSRVRAAIGLCNFMTDYSATRGLLEYINEVYNNALFDVFDSIKIQQIIDRGKEDVINYYTPLSSEEKKSYLFKALELLDDGTDAIYTDFLERLKNKNKLSISNLLSYIRDFYELDINATAEKSGKYDAVSIVTAHSSKGKEWEHVFFSLSDFDNKSSSKEETEENRRLIFVACTRAKYGLTITSLKYRKEKDSSSDNPISNIWYEEMSRYHSVDCI